MIALRTYVESVPVSPGFYDMNAAQYHADPCPEPSLSSSIAKLLVRKSPRHAWAAHPRLGGHSPEPPTREMCIGSAVHAMALGRGQEVFVITAGDYKTATAREQRDLALANGRIPLLEPDLARATAMAAPMRDAVNRFFPGEYLTEVVGVWEENGVWHRMMIDAISPCGLYVADLKTTVSAEPEAFSRQFFNMGYDIQEGFYRSGLDALLGVASRRYAFIAQEREMPEAITVHETEPVTREIVERDVAQAKALWAECITADLWPAYPRGPHVIIAPSWRAGDMDFDLEGEAA